MSFAAAPRGYADLLLFMDALVAGNACHLLLLHMSVLNPFF